MLANSKKQNLRSHLMAVGKLSLLMGRGSRLETKWLTRTYIAGLLHDIGKANHFFQLYMAKLSNNDDVIIDGSEENRAEKVESAFPHHHELSWAILEACNYDLSKALGDIVEVDDSSEDLVKDALWIIYNHHSMPKYQNEKGHFKSYESANEILSNCDANHINRDVSDMISLTLSVLSNASEFLSRPKIVEILSVDKLSSKVLNSHEEGRLNSSIPGYCPHGNRPKNLGSLYLSRSLMIQADRLVSALSSEDCDKLSESKSPEELKTAIKDIIKNAAVSKQTSEELSRIIGLKSDIDFPLSVNAEKIVSGRDIEQLQIANDSHNQKFPTSILSLWAGFGKTRTAIYWWAKGQERKDEAARQLIWVCPQNSIAEALVIQSSKDLSEMLRTGVISSTRPIVVELFTASKVRKRIRVSEEGLKEEAVPDNDLGFGADITITNIDNYSSPFIKHAISTRILRTFSGYVVFDEWHQFVSQQAIFSTFIISMAAREMVCKSKTLLLSATPMPIEHLWGDGESSRVIKASESGTALVKGRLEIKEGIQETSCILPDHSALVTTSRSSAQSSFASNSKDSDALIHGRYASLDKELILSHVLDKYGKGKSDVKGRLFASPIIEAAMDISFKYLARSITATPESLLQADGRRDRFINMNGKSKLILVIPNEKDEELSERAATRDLMDTRLLDVWRDKLLEWSRKAVLEKGGLFTKKELYALRDEFYLNEKVAQIFQEYTTGLLKNSLKALSRKRPIKYYAQKSISKEKSSSGGGLRNPEASLYVTTAVYEGVSNDCRNMSIDGGELMCLDENEATKNEIPEKFISKAAINLNKDGYGYPEGRKDKKALTKHYLEKAESRAILARKESTPIIISHKSYIDSRDRKKTDPEDNILIYHKNASEPWMSLGLCKEKIRKKYQKSRS